MLRRAVLAMCAVAAFEGAAHADDTWKRERAWFEWSTWIRVGYGVSSQELDTVPRSSSHWVSRAAGRRRPPPPSSSPPTSFRRDRQRLFSAPSTSSADSARPASIATPIMMPPIDAWNSSENTSMLNLYAR